VEEPPELSPIRNRQFSIASGSHVPAFRVAVGVGDPDRERALLAALNEGVDFVVAARCLAADDLLVQLASGQIDAALIVDDLHRLTDDALVTAAQSNVSLVVLARWPDDTRWEKGATTILPFDATANQIREALISASRRESPRRPAVDWAVPERDAELSRMNPVPSEVTAIAVASGYGSPGRSFVALNIAVALGAVAPTILVDSDVAGPSVAASLDLDPTRNLFMLAHADPPTPRDWAQALAQETQPLGPRSPLGVALCGVPKPEMRSGITPKFFERLLAELRAHYRYVVLDVGADLLDQETVLHRLALEASDQVLFVATADLVGLWHARVGLGTLGRVLSLDAERFALVINRHDRRYHHPRDDIAWALREPVAALLCEDPAHVQPALLRQQPVTLDARSRVGRQLLDLATRIHGGTIVLPPEPTRKHRTGLLDRLAPMRGRWPFHSTPQSSNGGSQEHDLATSR